MAKHLPHEFSYHFSNPHGAPANVPNNFAVLQLEDIRSRRPSGDFTSCWLYGRALFEPLFHWHRLLGRRDCHNQRPLVQEDVWHLMNMLACSSLFVHAKCFPSLSRPVAGSAVQASPLVKLHQYDGGPRKFWTSVRVYKSSGCL